MRRTNDLGMTVIVFIGFMVGLICLLWLITKGENASDNKAYNDNVCLHCGQEEAFELFDVSKGGNSNPTYYFYKCKNCGYVIELHHQKLNEKVLDK